ncbi:MAG: thermonuclease family protein [Candidatus Omnitrophica bacterium]|nr:thermonuclease family protein [Candidatus Omnitrophota bacterium]
MINLRIFKNLVVGIFLVFICSCVKNYDYSHIRITKIIDGDTVRLENGETLRYIGIDTPEIKIKRNGRFSYRPQPFALDAKKLNEKLVKDKIVRVEFDVEKTDRYNRLLGYCFIANTMVNAKLVEEGFAVIYTFPPNVKYVGTFVNAQKNARKNAKGMWGVYKTINPDDALACTNQIRTVKGKVSGAKHTKRGLVLDFGTSHFKIVIYNNAIKYFSDKGIDPFSFYKGKTMEVSGRIRGYNKNAQIIVSYPEEITIIYEE